MGYTSCGCAAVPPATRTTHPSVCLVLRSPPHEGNCSWGVLFPPSWPSRGDPAHTHCPGLINLTVSPSLCTLLLLGTLGSSLWVHFSIINAINTCVHWLRSSVGSQHGGLWDCHTAGACCCPKPWPQAPEHKITAQETGFREVAALERAGLQWTGKGLGGTFLGVEIFSILTRAWVTCCVRLLKLRGLTLEIYAFHCVHVWTIRQQRKTGTLLNSVHTGLFRGSYTKVCNLKCIKPKS